MVDWVIAAARELGADPVVVVASPSSKDAFEAGVEVAVQEQPLGTGDAVRCRARRARGPRRGRADPDRRHARAHRRTSCASSSRRTAREDAAATVLTFVPPDVRALRPHRPRRRRPRPRDRRGRATPRPRSSRSREVNASIYVFRAEQLWPALERLEPQNAQGELYLTDAVRFLVEDGETVAAHVAADPFEAEGVNTRVELAAAAAVLRDRINERHMLAGVTIVDPATTWIEPDVELEPDVDDPPVRLPARPHAGRARAPRSTRTRSRSTPRSGAARPSARSVTFAPGRSSRPDPKAGTFVEIKNSRIGTRTKVPHLSYIGDAEIGEDTNVGAGAITANFPHQPGRPKSRTTIGKNVRTGIHNGFVAPVEVGDGAWIAAGSVITKDVPAGRARGRAGAPGEQGGVCSPAPGRLSWFSPASTSAPSRVDRDRAAARALDRARAAEAADGLLRPLAPRARAADRRAARHPARRGRRWRRSRTARRTAATTSRSAAPTSSSSRRAASPIDQQPDGAAAA